MNQNFTADQLFNLCKNSELDQYKLTPTSLRTMLDEAFNQISNGSFNFNLTTSNNYFYPEDLVSKLIIRKLNDNIKRIYKDEQSNRRLIVKQVKALLGDDCPAWILKTDIQRFYESIDRSRIIEKLKQDSMLSYFSLQLIQKLFSHPLIISSTGLPKGIAISATLSEIYLRKYDKWVRSFSNVFYYARFVDDIIIFSNRENVLLEIQKTMESNLEGLSLNPRKTWIYDANNISEEKPLEFLGYKFTTCFMLKSDTSKKLIKVLDVSIAKSKVNKIKSRLVFSLTDYLSNKNYSLLENRIKFLTGNYSIRSVARGQDLKSGIYYNYNFVTQEQVFKELNSFFHKVLNNKKNKFGTRLSTSLSISNRMKLSRYSFLHGFKHKVYHSFSAKELKQIKNCWR